MKFAVRCCLLAILPGIAAAQDSSVDYLPQEDREGYELLEYSMWPEGTQGTGNDVRHSIKFRFFTKSLPGRWLSEQDFEASETQQEPSEEEQFVSLLLETYQNLTSLEDLERVLDPASFSGREEQYALDERTAFFQDSERFGSWGDVRPFALIRYANFRLILCDVRSAVEEEGENDYRLEVIPTVYQDNEYRLTEITSQTHGVDLVVNNFFFEDTYDGEIWAALRSRAGIVE